MNHAHEDIHIIQYPPSYRCY